MTSIIDKENKLRCLGLILRETEAYALKLLKGMSVNEKGGEDRNSSGKCDM